MTRNETQRGLHGVFTQRQRRIIDRIVSASKFSELPSLQQLTDILSENPNTPDARFETLDEISEINKIYTTSGVDRRIEPKKRNDYDWPPRYTIVKAVKKDSPTDKTVQNRH